MEGLTARFRVAQHDMRGHGMSERELPQDFAIGDDERCLQAVLECLKLERFVIYGIGGVGHLGVRYAAAHPERVEALILNGTTASVATPSFYAVAEENWEFFLRSFVPASAGPQEAQQWFETLGDSTARDDWLARSRTTVKSNIIEPLTRIRAPTLVLHARGLALTPSEGATRLAALIPNARLVLISGDHPLGDAAEGLAAIDSFLAEVRPERQDGTVRPDDKLSAREREVLRLLAAGQSNAQIAEALVISESTVAKHISSILAKTESANRTEAAAFAHRRGLA